MDDILTLLIVILLAVGFMLSGYAIAHVYPYSSWFSESKSTLVSHNSLWSSESKPTSGYPDPSWFSKTKPMSEVV